MSPTFFATPAAFRQWLEKHHATVAELWVGFYKKATGRPSITAPEAVDEALCFGWIDGIRKRVDDGRYVNRFTPRRTGSVWSAINTRRAEELIRAGRMRPAGLAAFRARDGQKTGGAPLEAPHFDAVLEARFKAHADAWAFFQSLPPGYRRTMTWWVSSAKQEATRVRRLEILIRQSAARQRIDPMKPVGQVRTSKFKVQSSKFAGGARSRKPRG